MIDKSELHKEIGFLFFDRSILVEIKEQYILKEFDIRIVKQNLKQQLSSLRKEDYKGLADLGINEVDFFEESKIAEKIINSGNDESNSNMILRYYYYQKFSLLFPDFWFLKPCFFLNLEELHELIKLPYFNIFLEYPLSNSRYFDFFTTVDLNYDYFIIPTKEATAIKKFIISKRFVPNMEAGILKSVLIIKRWR